LWQRWLTHAVIDGFSRIDEAPETLREDSEHLAAARR
jgi:hypothetical protein